MDAFGTQSGHWPYLAALFFSCLAYVIAWHWLERIWHLPANRLTWAATALGVGVILFWLAFMIPWPMFLVVALAFAVGGLPAVIRGAVLVIGYMVQAERVAARDETTTPR